MPSPGQVSPLKAKPGSALHWKCATPVTGAEVAGEITRSDLMIKLRGASIQPSCNKGFPFQKDGNELSLIQWRLHPAVPALAWLRSTTAKAYVPQNTHAFASPIFLPMTFKNPFSPN